MLLNRVSLRRATAGVGIASCVALVLAGCGGSTSTETASKTVTVQFNNGEEFAIIFQELAKMLEEQNPGVTVKLSPLTVDQTTGTNLQVLNSSNAPDVALLPLESPVYATMVKTEQLHDLSDVYADLGLEEALGEATTAAVNFGNTEAPAYYAVPYLNNLYAAIWYNKTMFEEFGIPEPADHRFESLDQLEQTVKALKDEGKEGLAVGEADKYQLSWMIDAILPTAATPSQFSNYLSSWKPGGEMTVKYTDDPFVKTLTRMQDMASAGIFTPGYLGMSVAQANAQWVAETSGMYFGANGDTGSFNDLGFEADWALLPPVDGGTKAQLTSYIGEMVGVPLKAKNADLGKKFIALMLSPEGQAVGMKEGILPAIKGVPESAYAELDPLVQSMLADVDTNGSPSGWSAVVPAVLGIDGLEAGLQSMVDGRISPEEIAAKQQETLESYIADN